MDRWVFSLTFKLCINLISLLTQNLLFKFSLIFRLIKIKEWVDANDHGASMIPFSGILEAKLMEMNPEDRATFCKENNTQR